MSSGKSVLVRIQKVSVMIIHPNIHIIIHTSQHTNILIDNLIEYYMDNILSAHTHFHIL